MSLMGSGGGGGRGFGGFPYRSAHQQGHDSSGRGRRGRRGGGRNNNRAPPRPSSATSSTPHSRLVYCANIFLPMDRRGRLIGTGGCVIKSLTATTQCSIHVPKRNPNNNNHDNINSFAIDDVRSAVHVKAAEISHLLHACWKIAELTMEETTTSDDMQNPLETTVVQYQLRLGPKTAPLGYMNGTLQRDACFLSVASELQSDSNCNDEANSLPENRRATQIGAYCIPIPRNLCSSDQIHVLVDNARFANPQLQVPEYTIAMEHHPADDDPTLLMFVYGETDLSRTLYNVLLKMVQELEASR